MKNYYAILEVPVGCPVAEIREAYRRLVQENLWNKETFAELKEAYEILTTPARRNEYDRATFGETFPVVEIVEEPQVTSDSSLRENARHCPMGAAAQCPIINARVPLGETFCPECGFLLSGMTTQEFEPIATLDPTRQTRLEDNAGHVHLLRPGLNTVGREATDVLLPDKTVSRRHAQIEIADDGSVTVEDLDSTNGTRIGSQVLAPGASRALADGDRVQFGSIDLRLRLVRPEIADIPEHREATPARARLVTARGPSAKQIPLIPGVTTIGRRAENSIVLRDDPYVSGNHAQIIAEEDTFRLTDLGSTNHTLVNGEELTANEPRLLASGDEIVIGGAAYLFERIEDAEAVPSAAEAPAPMDEAAGRTV